MIIERLQGRDIVSLKVGGEVAGVEVRSVDDLIKALAYAKENDKKAYPLGQGTNSYFDTNPQGVLIMRMLLKGSSVKFTDQSVYIAVASGEDWDDFVAYTVSQNWWGIENLSFIPGSVGASVVGNIGAYGAEVKNCVESVLVYDRVEEKTLVLSNEECEFDYRFSRFKREKNRFVVLEVTFKLSKTPHPILTYSPLAETLDSKASIVTIRNLVIDTRKHKLPDWKKIPNAGSFFKNPTVTHERGLQLRSDYPRIPLYPYKGGFKVSAAWMIDNMTKLKGAMVGNVGTWQNQPLVIITNGNATSEELTSFAAYMAKCIRDAVGIELEPEVEHLT